MEEIIIKEMKREDWKDALSLVWKVFLEYEAPEYAKEGVDSFHHTLEDDSYLSMLRMFGAYKDGKLVGVIATRSEGTHIAFFFVDGKYHRRGIGRKLFETIKGLCPSQKMTVNSSPYAVPVYHKLGFSDTDKEQTVDGIRFTPMELDL